MNRILYYALLVFFSISGASFMFLSSISFADPTNTITEKTEENKWYSVSMDNPGSKKLQYSMIDMNHPNIASGTILVSDIGRLSSLLYLFDTGSVSPLSFSGKTDIILSDIQGIVSFYDLFTTYKIHSQKGEFRLEQITNGSFYIGKEADGKLVIYAIDGVARLVFLDNSTEMTSMILFPGSYIRFDPKRNASLKGADLFRTILSLQEGENEIFEFVNPRVNIGDDKDTFFNYRLPLQTRGLFQVLSARFHNQVESVDLLKSYGNDLNFQNANSLPWLTNPTKKNYFMLLELKYLLAQVVKSSDSKTDEMIARIGTIYENAKTLQMESSTAKKTIEQFLLDGRFALYGNGNGIGSDYANTYEKIAQMIGIEPTAGKSKLLQNLADIYSGNLFLQTNGATNFRIDTYDPTATTLRGTLEEQGIDQRDYFDIAIYVYNILDKIHNKGIFSREYLENKFTYDYLTTFFYAGSRYMNSIEDPDKKTQTILSFSTQFYEKVLSMLVNSLYTLYMKDDNGFLYINETFLKNTDVKVDTAVMKNIKALEGVVSYVNDTIKNAFQNSGTDTDSYIKIQKATLRLRGIATLLDPEKHNQNYKAYIEKPYVTEMDGGVAVPKILKDLSGIDTSGQSSGEVVVPVTPVVSPSLTQSPLFGAAKKLFPDAPDTSFTSDASYIRVNNVTGYIKKIDESIGEGTWNLLFLDEKTVSQVNLRYGGRDIEIKFPTDRVDISAFLAFQNDELKKYLDIIDANSDIPGSVRIIISYKQMTIGENVFVVE